MGESVDLLFFDTFAHENSEELNLDLVQFPKPVFVTEVRIIPLGARVQADFPGGVRLGATNPSQFSIEFFVNDLGKPGASTFESLGGFEYNQNGCINLECAPSDSVRKVPTDGLVLRGWYTTITLAVYGILTPNITEQIIQPVVPPTVPPQTTSLSEVQQIIPVNTIKSEWNQENIQPVPIEYSQQPTVAYAQTYVSTEQFTQEYTDYYGEVPKDPRSYHNTPESDWDNKSQGRDRERDTRERGREGERYQKTNVEHDHVRLDSDRRDRHFTRSHSQDKDRQSREYRGESSRDGDRSRDRDWEHDHAQNFDYRDHSEKEWDRDRERDCDRGYKHQDNYRRTYVREDRDENRKRPRTPPVGSPKRPHTPHTHTEHKEVTPPKTTMDELPVDPQKSDWESSTNQSQSKGLSDKIISKDVPESQLLISEETLHMDVEEFEPILSDEDILDDSEHFQDLDYDYTSYTNNDDLIKLFVPSSTPIKRYEKSPAFCITTEKFEIDDDLKTVIGITDEFFRSSITKFKPKEFESLNPEIKEEFIHLCEKVMQTIGETELFCSMMVIFTKINDINCSILNESDQKICTQIKFIIEALIEWVQIALDFQLANAQIQPPYKIRHIKCGVRLADWCSTSLDFLQLLWKENYFIHDILLNLYSQEYMALSIKLMILRALDTYLLHKISIQHFIGRIPTDESIKDNGYLETKSNAENGYKSLIQIVCKNPSVRLKFSLQSILKKIHVYEILCKLHEKTEKLCHNSSCVEDINFIVNSLNQILEFYRGGSFVLSQPKRYLPVSAQFEVNRAESVNVFFNLFSMHNLLDCFIVLLTSEETTNLSLIKTPIFEFLSELLRDEEGLNFLLDNCDATNVLLKCLIQTDETIQYSLPFSMECKANELGLKIAFKLQCCYHVDYLIDIGEKKTDCDTSEVIEQLHSLYCLTFSYIGKVACSEVLGLKDNIKCLLQFLDILQLKDKNEQQLEKIKKSVAFFYIVDLISVAIVYNSEVNLLQKYSKQFLQIIDDHELFEASVSAKINEFAPYVKPYESICTLSYDNINPIVEIINKYTETVTSYPGQLVTCLRVLEHLGISKHENKSEICIDNPLNSYTELKYKHVIIQLFSVDGVAILTKIMQKICEHYEQPSLHTTTFVSNQSICILNVLQPCLTLLKQMLTYVIQCRSTNFKDLTTVSILLQTYNLLRTFPNSSPAYFAARKQCEKIIDTLLVYTQPISEELSDKDSLSKTLWTCMCAEVIKYINLAPYTFISGLLVFSELLPLPLPIQTREPLKDEEITWALNLRKLWSAHLHSCSASIQELINRLCISSHPPLLNLLRKFCIQLADLAANSAVMIARGVLDTIHNVLMVEENSAVPCNSNIARLLNILACLVTHNSFKSAILHLLHPNNINVSKCDEKYPSLIQAFTKIIIFKSSVNSHVQSQECVLSIVQSLCDTEITLLHNFSDKNEVTSEIYLANSLPCKENLLLLINAMLDHLSSDNSFLTYLPILRTLLLLNEHDYGFYHLREQLLKRNEPFLRVLSQLVENFVKDNEECLSTINTLMELLRMCLVCEELSGTPFPNLRTLKMGVDEVKAIIGWESFKSTNQEHPLHQLESLLQKTGEEDKTFENYLLEGVTTVLGLLNKESVEVKEAFVEIIVPAPSSLLIQFANRPIFTLSDAVDEQLTSDYWLSTPTDEVSGDLENVTCDLSEVCRQYLPLDVNLIREIEKLCRIYPSNNGNVEDNKTKGIDTQKTKNKKTFATPLARRGFPRTIQARADLFRSRPPNTSRPPSLHVDDFVALETCGAQPTGPTGYNKISRELLATSRVTRGSRGRSFPNSERAVQYRQMSWWSTGLGRGPYH